MIRPIHFLLLAAAAAMASPVHVDQDSLDREAEEWERKMDEGDDLQEEILGQLDEEDEEDEEEMEEEDRLEMEEDRLGRPSMPDVECGKWTNRRIEINSTAMVEMKTMSYTKRCTVLFEPVQDCEQVILTCTKFFVDNRDPHNCDIGDVFQTRIGDDKPRKFCKYEGPTDNFPILSKSNLKADYKRSIGLLGFGRFPNKGVKCMARCNSLVNSTMYY